ncbi:FAD-dependent monooxygenase [Streptomyces sp. NPDC096079]|uniref:FAD-dependent monooxygenase n=1 Tax=unclassified Streptomyces TaxID=2593676 RepID=UPI00332CF1E7
MTDPVIVVGAGPTGLMLACELGLAGAPVVVLDRRDAPDPHAPGQAVNAGVIALLEQRGLADALRASGLPLPGAHFSLLWLHPEELTADRPEVGTGLLVAQPRLTEVLEQRARELGVDIRRGHEVTELRQSPGHVTLKLRTSAGDSTLRGSYVVAADGAGSTVRRLAGIDFPGSGWTVSGIVGDVAADFSELAVHHLGAHYLPAGGVYSGAPAGPGVLRVITTVFGATPSTPSGPVAAEELQGEVEHLTGQPLPAREVLWARRFTSHSGNAERYRSGRVFLAGDAAHSFYPLGGLRLSTCLQDAVNLGWKLAADLAGWAPPGLLDTYHAERHPEGERARLALDAQLALMHPAARTAGARSLVADLARFDDVNRYLVELVTGVDLRYRLGTDGASGSVTPDPALGGRVPGAAPLLHDGGGLLLLGSSEGDGEQGEGGAHARTAAAWADRVGVAPALAADATRSVLLRPDGHVVWAEGSGSLETALKNWFGAPR